MVKKIDAYLLPWSFWKCQWRHWFSMVSFCLRHVVHLVTISSICFLRPGHQTESRTLSRNLRLPWCPAWILSRMSNRIYVGMMIVWSFTKTSLDSNSSPPRTNMVSMRCSVLIYLASLRYRIQTYSCILHHSVGEVLTHPVFSLLLESSPRCVKRTSFIFFLLSHVVSWTNTSSVSLEIFEFLGVVHPGFLNQREAQVVFDRFQLGYLCPGYNRWTSHMPRLLQAPPFRFGRIFVLYWSLTLTRRQQAFSLCCLALAQV